MYRGMGGGHLVGGMGGGVPHTAMQGVRSACNLSGRMKCICMGGGPNALLCVTGQQVHGLA